MILRGVSIKLQQDGSSSDSPLDSTKDGAGVEVVMCSLPESSTSILTSGICMWAGSSPKWRL